MLPGLCPGVCRQRATTNFSDPIATAPSGPVIRRSFEKSTPVSRDIASASSAWQYTGSVFDEVPFASLPSGAIGNNRETSSKPGTFIPSASKGGGGVPPTWSKW